MSAGAVPRRVEQGFNAKLQKVSFRGVTNSRNNEHRVVDERTPSRTSGGIPKLLEGHVPPAHPIFSF